MGQGRVVFHLPIGAVAAQYFEGRTPRTQRPGRGGLSVRPPGRTSEAGVCKVNFLGPSTSTRFSGRNSLAGQIVVLVEDDALGLSKTEDLLLEAGADVVLAGNYYQAMLVARLHEPTAAVLDIALGRQTIDCIGAHLGLHAVPYLLVVGSSGGALCGHWRLAPPFRGPFAKSELIAGLARMLACSDWRPD